MHLATRDVWFAGSQTDVRTHRRGPPSGIRDVNVTGKDIAMPAFAPLQVVRVRRLVARPGAHDGWAVNRRSPNVGDVGAVVEVVWAPDEEARYVVECVDSEGATEWLAELSADELEPIEPTVSTPLAADAATPTTTAFLYVAWFRDVRMSPDDQDYEWPACFVIECSTGEEALAWGDRLAASFSRRRGYEHFLHSTIELAAAHDNLAALPVVPVGYDASDTEIGW